MIQTKEWLIAARKQRKITQKELAQQIGVTTNAISNIEQGQRLGSIETWSKINNFFNGINGTPIKMELCVQNSDDLALIGKRFFCYNEEYEVIEIILNGFRCKARSLNSKKVYQFLYENVERWIDNYNEDRNKYYKSWISLPCNIGDTVWVSLNNDKSFHSGKLLGLKANENDLNYITYIVHVTDEEKEYVDTVLDTSFTDYFNKIYTKLDMVKS